ncbi:MAG TPA: ABC transporter permease [Acidimicrobiia bacterium]|nr:ABC transporter permease [Acidimicrobiia bacterium]
MSDFLNYVILGVPFGCVFALVAVGLVLTYKTSGVFNLAFGAQAFVSAAVFYNTVSNHDWPLLPAFIVSVFIVAPLVGLILDRALYRHLRTAPAVAKLVTSIGLLIAIPEIVKLLPDFDFLQSSVFNPPTIWPNPFAYYHFGDYVLDGNQVATLISTAAAVLFLTALFRWTTVGLQMRAVVESPRMTELAGINADRVSAFSWMLSSTFAGLAGVLLAPLFAQLAAPNFTILLIAAIAAAAFGRLTSIPLAFLGGILLGVAQGILGGYLPADSILANGLRPSLPFVVLFLLLLFWPGLRKRSEIVDPLSGVDPPPPGLSAEKRMRLLTYTTWGLGVAVIAVGLYVALFVVSSFWLLIITKAVIFSLIFLSITVITGMAGQISLCQASFAAVGSFGTAQLAQHFGLPVLLTMVIGAAMAAVVGGLLAIPALRLGGIFLALATLAFALMFESIFVPLDWVSGGVLPTKVPRPTFLESDRTFLLFALGLLVVISLVVILVRKGTTGRYLDALRGSETAATAIGINPARARIVAFALSAGIAGLGGGLLAIQENQANYTGNFQVLLGLLWLVIVVTIGARTVEGAVQAGLAIAFVPEILKALGLSPTYQFILFGLGAVTYAKHPEGILEYNKRRSLETVQRWLTRGKAPRDGTGGEVIRTRPEPATVGAGNPGQRS